MTWNVVAPLDGPHALNDPDVPHPRPWLAYLLQVFSITFSSKPTCLLSPKDVVRWVVSRLTDSGQH